MGVESRRSHSCAVFSGAWLENNIRLPLVSPFNAMTAGRKESGTEPIAPLAWAMVLAIAIFSCYVYVLSEQVNRAETLRHVWLQKTAAPDRLEQFSATPAEKNAIGYPGPPTEGRHDLTGTAVLRR